jgi:triphosphoribosyl-dephospho-CoA synthetase
VIGTLAAISTFTEITTTPKPGLVDSCGTGAHSDMDWTLFMLSAGALAPYWEKQVLEGMTCGETGPYPDLFRRLRARGVEMEHAMFEATGGVNTHKGLIFALSLLAGSAGLCLNGGGPFPEKIRKKSSEIAAPFMEEAFREIKIRGRDLSHGERIYLEHGVGGIRMEAMSAFPSLGPSLDAYESAANRGAEPNDAALYALLTLMTICEDTNVIHRAGMEFWRGVYMKRAHEALEAFDPIEPDYKPLFDLDKFLVKNGASPGGAADLLACTLFLYSGKMLDNRKGGR